MADKGVTKFSRFPDIDASQRDTFETPDDGPDNVETDILGREEPIASEDVVETSISAIQAFEVFMGKRYDPTSDFSDSLRPTSRPKPALVIPGRGQHEKFESPIQKIRRLQSELDDFTQELKALREKEKEQTDAAAKTPQPLPAELSDELKAMQKQLEDVLADPSLHGLLLPRANVEKQLESQKELSKQLAAIIQSERSKDESIDPVSESSAKPSRSITYELYYAPEASKYAQLSTMSQLESRIASLEKLLGSPETNLAASGLAPTVDELRKKVTLLDVSRLDAFQQKLKSLTPQLDVLIKQKNLLGGSGVNDKKVSELFSMVERWDSVAQNLPQLASRLQSLRTLHEECADLRASVLAILSEQGLLTESTKSCTTLLDELRKTFESNMSQIGKNITSVEQRISDLQSNIAKLGH
mmetsp:Transcript_22955/g.38448  ORF Transcript_22955/g.38448 Transcript_22955/m.38448 type:complete len:415 (+) Transcript_22955:34-1278(+)